jgi:hypothetical protein
MNDLNQLEKQLESWTPRAPSAGLKRRLFAAPDPVEGHAAGSAPLAPVWLKFAPVSCMILLITLFCIPRHESRTYLAVSGGSNLLASLSSNLAANCATDLRDQRQNVWREATFDWTKDGRSLSTTGSFQTGKTNLQKF